MGLLSRIYRQRQIARLFQGSLSGTAILRLRARLRTDAVLSHRYEQYACLESALCGDASFSPFAVERAGKGLFATLDKHRPQVIFRGRLLTWLAAPAAALVVVAMLVTLSRRDTVDRRQSELELAVRGGVPFAANTTGVRAYRVSSSPGESLVETSLFSVSDLMTFSYTNYVPHIRYLALFGVQQDGDIRWYYPGYEGDESVRVEAKVVDEPLHDGIRLSINHRPGALCVLALFSETPLSTVTIDSAVFNTTDCDELADSLELMRSDVVVHSLAARIDAASRKMELK